MNPIDDKSAFNNKNSSSQPQPTAAHGELTNQAHRQPRSIGVLIVEHDRTLLKSLERGLREQGLMVWSASDGCDGIALYSRYQADIDIVLSENQMPGFDGLKIIDALSAINPAVRTCFMTKHDHPSAKAQLLMRGAKEVFIKPLPPLVVVAAELQRFALISNDGTVPQGVAGEVQTGTRGASSRATEDKAHDGIFKRLVSSIFGSDK